MRQLPPGFVAWRGGRCPVHPQQLVQCYHPGADPNDLAAAPGPVMEACQLSWSHRNSALTDEPHHGNIMAYRLVSRIAITIVVDDAGSDATVHTKASVMREATIRPLLAQAEEALQAEIAALESCPFHQRRSAAGSGRN